MGSDTQPEKQRGLETLVEVTEFTLNQLISINRLVVQVEVCVVVFIPPEDTTAAPQCDTVLGLLVGGVHITNIRLIPASSEFREGQEDVVVIPPRIEIKCAEIEKWYNAPVGTKILTYVDEPEEADASEENPAGDVTYFDSGKGRLKLY